MKKNFPMQTMWMVLVLLVSLVNLTWETVPAQAQALIEIPRPRVETENLKPIQIDEYRIEVQILGGVCRTETTIRFWNPNSGMDLEGNLVFPLPEGVTVSGYALDVDGVMVDAVPVTKEKARTTLETETRRNVDPGIVEAQRGNQFKTRVYPLPAEGFRTVKIRTVSALESIRSDSKNRAAETAGTAAGQVRIPLRLAEPVKVFSLKCVTSQGDGVPELLEGEIPALSFRKMETAGYSAEIEKRNFQTEKDLVLEVPLREKTLWMEKSSDGFTYFAAVVRKPAEAGTAESSASESSASESSTSGSRSAENANADGSEGPKNVKAAGSGAPFQISSVNVFWDCSGSRSKTGFAGEQKKETDFLLAWLESAGVETVRLIPFRNVIEAEEVRWVKREDICAALAALPCDGATNITAAAEYLKALHLPENSVTFLFTDGFSNWENVPEMGTDGCLFTFSSGNAFDAGTLRSLAFSGGGVYVNLEKTSIPQAVETVAKALRGPQVQPIFAENAEIYPRYLNFTESGEFQYFTGRTRTENAAFRIGEEAALTVSALNAPAGETLRTLFAQRMLENLLLTPKQEREAIEKLGKEFSLVTPETSLIVLESLDQYLEHEIEPPVQLAEMRQVYLKIQKEEQTRNSEKLPPEKVREARLNSVVEMWKVRRTWYEKDFSALPKKKLRRFLGSWMGGISGVNEGFEDEESDEDLREFAPAAAPAVEAEAPIQEAIAEEAAEDWEAEDLADEDSFTEEEEFTDEDSFAEEEEFTDEDSFAEEEESAEKMDEGKRSASIQVQGWNPDSTFKEEISRAKEPYAKYLALRQTNARSPSFFLGCADLFRDLNDEAKALRILSNLAELELENHEILRTLAYRLLQYGEISAAVGIFESVLELRPEEPQSYRDLALALTRRIEADLGRAGLENSVKKDCERAFELYSMLILGRDFEPWDARFPEIELFAIEEANALIPTAQKAGVTEIPLDERLIAPVDLDLRIVLTWSGDDTDMDLWVTEPSNERVCYSHPLSQIGGMISADFIQGYGPEEYLLRRAENGNYQIQAHFYSSSSVRILGEVTVQAEVFTNFGRPNQNRESITFQLRKKTDSESEETFQIGNVEFQK